MKIAKKLSELKAPTIAIFFLILIFLSYLIPEWSTALNNPMNFFSNAWDEPNYLTHQMAVMNRFTPSYWFGENIYLFLEKFGISGSWQNIFFDTFLIPFIVISSIFILKKTLPISWVEAIILSILVWFSPVLFSYTNPIIGNLFSYQFPTEKSLFISSVYTFPAIFRTPNPQLSYFCIVLGISFYLRFKKLLILLVPLPFLYFPIFVFYAYFAFAWIAYQLVSANFTRKLMIANLVSSILIVCMMLFLTKLPSLHDIILFSQLTHQNAYLATYARCFQLPLVFILFFPLTFILFMQKNKRNANLWFFYITGLMCVLICSNIQIVTGVLFAPKIFQSDSATIIAGILLAILLYSPQPKDNQPPPSFLHSLFTVFLIIIVSIFLSVLLVSSEVFGKYFYYLKPSILLLFLLLTVIIYFFFYKNKILSVVKISSAIVTLIIILGTQKFSFDGLSFSIKKYAVFTPEQIKLIHKSPFLLITGEDASFYAQFLPYAIATLDAPFQSVHYRYKSFLETCPNNPDYFSQALMYVKNTPDILDKKELINELQLNINQSNLVPNKFTLKSSNFSYCRETKKPEPFFILEIKEKIREIKIYPFHYGLNRG